MFKLLLTITILLTSNNSYAEKVEFVPVNRSIMQRDEMGYKMSKLETKIADLEKKIEDLTAQIEILDDVQTHMKSKINSLQAGEPVEPFYKSHEEPNEGEFDYAFKMLDKNNYARAKRAFELFIEKYPKDSKVGEAYFWLGEVAYKAKDYKEASRNYLISYRDYKNSTRRNDALFKLSIVLSLLGKKGEACSGFDILIHDTPTIDKSLKRKALDEEINIGCRN